MGNKLAKAWPVFGLKIQTPTLKMRVLDDSDLPELLEVAVKGIHDPQIHLFQDSWTKLKSPDFELSFLKTFWSMRAELKPNKWVLPFVVIHQDKIVGIQELESENFNITRAASTSSWLGLEHQGKGIGKEMRAGILYLIFEHLGAVEAYSAALNYNHASQGVTKSLGYESEGGRLIELEGASVRQNYFRLTKEKWEAETKPKYQVSVAGVEPCLYMLGIKNDS